MFHQQLEIFCIAAFILNTVRSRDDRLILLSAKRLDRHIGNAQISQQQFLQDTRFPIIPLGDFRDGFRRDGRLIQHAGQFFQKPLIGIFRLRQIPVIGGHQIQLVVRRPVAERRLLRDILPKFIFSVFPGENQSFPTVGPMVKVFAVNPLCIKRKAVYIADGVVDIHYFKGSRLPVSRKRLPRKLLSL